MSDNGSGERGGAAGTNTTTGGVRRVAPVRSGAEGTPNCDDDQDMTGASWRFVESPIFETLVSMQALLVEWYDEPWAEEARETMGVNYLRDLRSVLEPFRLGIDLFELAVPEAMEQEVEGFVRRVREMPFAEFSYFVFGRLIPMKEGQLSIDLERIRDLIENYGVYTHYLEGLTRMDWHLTGPGFQEAFAHLVEQFWERYLKSRYPRQGVQRGLSIARNEAYGREKGLEALVKVITDREKVGPLRSGEERLRQVAFIPVVNIVRPTIVYSGHEDVTVVYRASRTPDRTEELTEKERQLIAVSRALGDQTRFQIAKLLFQNHKSLNGQNIADRVHLSKSVVSKHLKQLKDAGIVLETSPDKRNNIYSLDIEVLRRFSPGLIEVFRG